MRILLAGGLSAALSLTAFMPAVAQYHYPSALGNYRASYGMPRPHVAYRHSPNPEVIPTPNEAVPLNADPTNSSGAPTPHDSDPAPAAPSIGYGDNETPVSPYDAVMSTPHDGGCGCDYVLADTGRCGWYAGLTGLVMNRDEDAEMWLNYDPNVIASRVHGTRDASMDWSGGFEVNLGRYLSDHCATEAVYWGVYPSDQEVTAYAADLGALAHAYSFDSLAYDSGNGDGPQAVDARYDTNVQQQRLRRSYEIHNVEWNFLNFACTSSCFGGCGCGVGAKDSGCGYPMRVGVIAGVRWFRFGETFQFASDDQDTVWDYNADELFHDIDVTNDLVGFQLGLDGEYQLSYRFSLTFGGKVGVYNNHAEKRTAVRGGTGDAARVVVPGSPYDGQAFDLNDSKEDVAFLGELNLGARWRFCNCWNATLGYRAVAASGVALTTSQFPATFDDLPGAAKVDTNSSLILHGGYAGLEFNY